MGTIAENITIQKVMQIIAHNAQSLLIDCQNCLLTLCGYYYFYVPFIKYPFM